MIDKHNLSKVIYENVDGAPFKKNENIIIKNTNECGIIIGFDYRDSIHNIFPKNNYTKYPDRPYIHVLLNGTVHVFMVHEIKLDK